MRGLVATLVVLAAFALVFVGGGEPAAQERQGRPNVLVLMTDDQTLRSLEVMPNVRRLIGGEGTTFERSFVSFSLCCPSRATFYTGQYAHNHTILGNQPPVGGYDKLDKREWLPVWLQRAGYRTVHLGKFLNGYGSQGSAPTEVPPGWSEWYGSVDPSTYRFYDYTLNENGALVTYGANGDPAFYQTDFYARRASELIGRLAPAREPFFLSVAFLAPHAGRPREPDDPRNQGTPAPAPRHKNRFASEPFPQPPSFNEGDVSDKPRFIRNRRPIGASRVNAVRENYRQRLESLLAVDEAIPQILGTLRQTGELDDTLVLLTSDNGFFHGEHRLPSGKVWVYEPSIRVPLIMRGPGVPVRARRRQLVTNVDLAPTILDAANARPGRAQDGRSLYPLLRDPLREWGRDVLIEGADGGPNAYDAIRTYRFVYVEYATGDRELYDLRRDPHQLQSLHADPAYAAIRDRLARRLAGLRGCAGRGCRTRPRLALRVRFRGRRCVRGRLRARVTGAERRALERVDFFVRGRLVARDRRAPFVKRLRRRLRRGRRFRVRARAATVDGRLVTLDRRLRACRRR
jgi:N-acetylglucosamine-6-sulfatase